MTGRLHPAPQDRVWAPRLAVALVAGPAAWILRLLIGLALVPYACQSGAWILHLPSLGFGAIALAALVISVRTRRRLIALLSTDNPATDRTRFVALLAVALNAAALLAIVIEGFAVVVVGPCLR